MMGTHLHIEVDRSGLLHAIRHFEFKSKHIYQSVLAPCIRNYTLDTLTWCKMVVIWVIGGNVDDIGSISTRGLNEAP